MLNFKIKQKMTLGLLVPLIIMSCICFLAVNMMGKIESGVVRIYNDRVVPLEELKFIGDDYAVYVIDAINKANAGAFTAEEASKALRDASLRISKKWQAFLTTELTEEEVQLSQEANRLFSAADLSISQMIQKLDGFQGQINGQLGDDILPLYDVIDPISDKISELVALQLRGAGEEKNRVSELYSSSVTVFMALTLVAIVVSIFIGLWVKRAVMLPIDDIVVKLATIQKESDLTVTFKIFNDDELGQISSNLTLVINHLREILESIFHASNTVGDSTAKLREFTQKNSERMYEQQSETEQTATAMNQMVATVAEVAQNTTVAADSAKDADTSAADGDKIVQQSITSMSFLSDQIEQAAEVIGQLSEESRNIGSVLDVIKGIAEQTNLLALNAAIEAARAGEQGRGFAVVADEVRTLAQRTQKSTQEIESMIERLQKGVQQAVTSMEMGIKLVHDANDKANLAGQALNKIVDSVDNISHMNVQIATAAEEQSSVAESINRSIITISDIALASTDASHELSSSVEELSSLSENMRSQVGKFKL
ncbi:methyl-accepting chemotaxis protein [Shewanella sp. D64]|uniref:methyl-accepting chemotaxis protein n=1 Tax=unclassified Shewanella TaxID=196818 RepID=UPI0022BA2C5D|nr:MULTISPECIES: methyl-accepting chemotaxis protein [unclassified Shewanella]MEC4727492.1 methyl-accepting chemotaxis protein [Shewanella sp. D64]MEC4738099.1 methyl-accepting chemotaxis protein [Shewanella sp. E94]WBJ96387.1 methyl-accepting chemotaxis protein [Shewanella sp. MTB7]